MIFFAKRRKMLGFLIYLFLFYNSKVIFNIILYIDLFTFTDTTSESICKVL